MTPQLGIGILSLVGAAIFSLAGFLYARMRFGIQAGSASIGAAQDLPLPPSPPDQTAQQLRQTQKQLEASSAREQTLKGEIKALEERLAATVASSPPPSSPVRDSLAPQLEQYKKKHSEAAQRCEQLEKEQRGLKQQLAALQGKAEEVRRLEKQIAELQGKAEGVRRLEKQIAELQGKAEEVRKLEKQVAELQSTATNMDKNEKQRAADASELSHTRQELQRKSAELKQAIEDRGVLEVHLSQARKEQEGNEAKVKYLERAELERADLAVRNEILQNKLKSADNISEENSRLKMLGQANEDLKKENQRLQDELARLGSLKIVQQKASPSNPHDYNSKGMIGKLQQLVHQVSKDNTIRGVVLSDLAGLVVASSGTDAEPLAAAAALFNDTSKRIQKLLPISRIQQTVLVDENSLSLTTRPLALADEAFLLVTLSAGPGPNQAAFEKLMAQPLG